MQLGAQQYLALALSVLRTSLMTWPSNYETARSKVVIKPGQRPYVVCTSDRCAGWEWVSNGRNSCRRCGGQMSEAPKVSRKSTPRPGQRQRKDSRDRRAAPSDSSAASTDVPESLLSMLQQQLPKLQQQFPELARQVQEAAPSPAPAAVLHSAQAKCQIAFKALNSAEAFASELEAEAAQLVEDLQSKVQQLAEAQSAVHNARHEYDEAAKVAQNEVQKLRSVPPDVQSNFTNLLKTMSAEQLEEASSAMAEAAKAARENVDLHSSAHTPGNSPVLASEGEPSKKNAEVDAGTGKGQVDVRMAPAETILAQGGDPFPPAPPPFAGGDLPPPAVNFANNGAAVALSQDALDEAARLATFTQLLESSGGSPTPVPAPLLADSTKERAGSRSPRRQEPPAAEVEHSPSDPAAKVKRGSSDSDALSARARSHSTAAASVQSTKSLPATHYEHIADGLRDQLANIKTSTTVVSEGGVLP